MNARKRRQNRYESNRKRRRKNLGEKQPRKFRRSRKPCWRNNGKIQGKCGVKVVFIHCLRGYWMCGFYSTVLEGEKTPNNMILSSNREWFLSLRLEGITRFFVVFRDVVIRRHVFFFFQS
jgi:hypothetical protein